MSLSPQEINTRLDQILLSVQKPGRYVGGELNQVQKRWDEVATRIALVFPDIYDVGLPNLGLAILYDLINQRTDTLAERVFSPWIDMETAMRQNGIPLYSLESRRPLSDFDILGFTLPYETLYTNVLNILDLAGIPLLSSQRLRDDPIIIAGGHATFNPEPMHLFIDAFVIGEGEEVIHEVIFTHQKWKSSGSDRAALLTRMAQIPGVYVPSLYEVHYNGDGTIHAIVPLESTAPARVRKRIVTDLGKPLTRFVVPNIDVVHNRVAVEIMRGCSRGCRFCHAGMTGRPIRERRLIDILDGIEEALNLTGYEEVGLLSLSSSDYTHINELVEAISTRFSDRHLSVALPSLRIESFSVNLMDRLKKTRPSGGFTLAPEAASERMRNIINKPVSSQLLLETAEAVFCRGWTSLKLYFMIGHPAETMEDVYAIAELCKQVLAVGKRFVGGRARVHAGVSTFVPKAHTPFQWTACDSSQQIQTKLDVLKQKLRQRNIKLTWTEPRDTQLEAWLSRGDRRIADVIFRAWQKGSRFDAWQDQHRHELWEQAFTECGLTPDFYNQRVRLFEEIFPWNLIDTGVSRTYLIREAKRAAAGEITGDCQEKCTRCGILPTFAEARRRNLDAAWKCPEGHLAA